MVLIAYFKNRLKHCVGWIKVHFYEVNSFNYTKYYLRTYYYIMDKFCSAELIGYKIQVPCFPEKYLLNSYGKNWWKPESVNYRYENVVYKLETLTDLEWNNSYRYYLKNGQIDFKSTKWLILQYLKN